MEREFEPTITKDLIEKSTSDEAIHKLVKLDMEYQKKESELNNLQQDQDGNFYMGRLTRLHHNKNAESYATNRKHAQILLYDDYRYEAETIFIEYHPDYEYDIQEIFTVTIKDTTQYRHGYNQGYTLQKNEPGLSKQINMALIDKETDIAQGLKDGSEQSAYEANIKEHDNLKSRFLDNTRDVSRNRNQDLEKK